MAVYDDVVIRLGQLGYTVPIEQQDAAVLHAITCATDRLTANINHKTVPAELNTVLIDMAAGLFLSEKKSIGALGTSFDFSRPAKRITEGDITVEYAGKTDGGSTPEARFDELLDRLINPPQWQLAHFRRVKW